MIIDVKICDDDDDDDDDDDTIWPIYNIRHIGRRIVGSNEYIRMCHKNPVSDGVMVPSLYTTMSTLAELRWRSITGSLPMIRRHLLMSQC